MKITVTQTSQNLRTILWTNYSKLTKDRGLKEFALTIQNLTAQNLYVENWEAATVANWYKIFAWASVEIRTINIDSLYFIAEWADATDVRIITT